MAQIVSPGAPVTPPAVVTVAELQRRNRVVTDAAGVSVGSLQRREGRAPHSADRPVQPRLRERAVAGDGEQIGSRPLVRRAAIATGALLAAASVFGAAILSDSSWRGSGAPAPGDPDAERGPLEGRFGSYFGPLAGPAAPGGDAPDPGTAAPLAWMPVAFPSAAVARGGSPVIGGESPAPGAAAAGSGSANAPATSGGTPPAAPAAPVGSPTLQSPPSVEAPAARPPAARSTPTTPAPSVAGPATRTTPTAAPRSGPVSILTAPVAGGAEDLGDGVGGPVGGLVGGLGSAVDDTGRVLDDTLAGGGATRTAGPSPTTASPSEEPPPLVGTLTEPVGETLGGATGLLG